MKNTLRSVGLALAFALFSNYASAANIVGLTNNNEVFTIANASAPGNISGPYAVTGVASGQSLVALDYGPMNGTLYALGYTSATGQAQLYTIDMTSHVATAVNTTPVTLQLGNAQSVGFDFNPMTNGEIHVVGMNGNHYTLNANTGAMVNSWTNLGYASGDINQSMTAKIGATGYTNSFYGSDATTQIGYDLNNNVIVRFNAANMNEVQTSGLSGLLLNANAGVGMDSYYDENNHSNTTYLTAQGLLSSGSNLYTLNNATGLAISLGSIGNGNMDVRDISVEVNRNVPASVTGSLMAGLTLNTGDLVFFDSDQPGIIRNRLQITGMTAGQTMLAVDFRPATGMLYGLGYNNTSHEYQLYTIDINTGVATAVNTPVSLNLGSTDKVSFDFNPVTDRIHLTGNGNTNVVIDAGTGAILSNNSGAQYASGDANVGVNANLSALAHTNSYAGATTTDAIGLEMSAGSIVNVNFGSNTTLQTLANLTGLLSNNGNTGNNGSMDIYYNSNTGANEIFVTSNNDGDAPTEANYSNFYTVDDNSFTSTPDGSVGPGVPLRDVAAQPNTVALAVGNINNTATVSVYPNPAANTLNISLSGKATGHVSVQIQDISGRVVANYDYTNPGSVLSMNIRSLTAGVYTVRMQEEGKPVQAAKFVKQL